MENFIFRPDADGNSLCRDESLELSSFAVVGLLFLACVCSLKWYENETQFHRLAIASDLCVSAALAGKSPYAFCPEQTIRNYVCTHYTRAQVQGRNHNPKLLFRNAHAPNSRL